MKNDKIGSTFQNQHPAEGPLAQKTLHRHPVLWMIQHHAGILQETDVAGVVFFPFIEIL